MDLLKWLTEWYKSKCNGDWEHCYGIKIQNIDNPGWWIEIDINETELEDRPFEMIEVDNSDNDWYFCKIEKNVFTSSGDPDKLLIILEIFKNWVECTDKIIL